MELPDGMVEVLGIIIVMIGIYFLANMRMPRKSNRCHICHGSGQIGGEKCESCNGKGYV